MTGVESYPRVGEPRPEGATGGDVRAVRTLSAAGSGVRVRREHFVPASGAFGRATTFVTNPGPEARSLILRSSLLLVDGSWSILSTSDGDATLDGWGRWLVLADGGRRLGLLLGPAWAGPRASARRSAATKCAGRDPAGAQRDADRSRRRDRAFTTFSLARPATADVGAEMEGLLEPDAVAFEGLSPEERGAIVNQPPPGPPTGLSGTVRGPSGASCRGHSGGPARRAPRRAAAGERERGVHAVRPAPGGGHGRGPRPGDEPPRPARRDRHRGRGRGPRRPRPPGRRGPGSRGRPRRVRGRRRRARRDARRAGRRLRDVLESHDRDRRRRPGDGERCALRRRHPALGRDGRGSRAAGTLPPGGVLSLSLSVPVVAQSVSAPVSLAVEGGAPVLVDGDGRSASVDGASPSAGAGRPSTTSPSGGGTPSASCGTARSCAPRRSPVC